MSTEVDLHMQLRHLHVETVNEMSTKQCLRYQRVETVSGISTGVDCCCNCNGDGVEIVSKMSTEVDQLN